MQTIFSMIIKIKTYNTKIVWNSVVKLLAKENFKRWLVCDEFDTIRSNRFQTKAYTKRNSKRTVRMDSPRRGASFSYMTHASTIHDCGTMKGLWESCLEEGERKLNEGEGKRVYV
jgi:hypothetical protein